jgi:hypothetical protein
VTTKQIAAMAGCRLEDLSRWRTQDLIGPPRWVPGHGKGGRICLWTVRDARRVWCLTRIDGRFHDQHLVLEQLEFHVVGALYVTDAEVVGGHPEMLHELHVDGALIGGRLTVLDLDSMSADVGRMLALTATG